MEGMELAKHVIWRECLHVMAGYGLCHAIFIFQKEVIEDILGVTWLKGVLYALCLPLLVVFFITFREPYDAANGDPAWKSTLDIVFWVIGILLGIVVAVFYSPRMVQMRRNIFRQLGWKNGIV